MVGSQEMSVMDLLKFRSALALALAVTLIGCGGSKKQEKSDSVGSAASAMQQESEARKPDAADMARKKCIRLSARECYFEGMTLQADGKADLARAFFDHACGAGEMEACYDLALLYEDGEGGVEQDLERAKSLYEKACNADTPDPTACSNLGYMYKTGNGVEADAKKATELYSRSCEIGSLLGCTNYAGRLAAGDGVERDVAKAEALLSNACNSGFFDACGQWLAVHARGCPDGEACGDDPVALPGNRAVYEASCTQGEDPVACVAYGAVLENGFGDVEKDQAKALAQFEASCEAGVQLACYKTADYYRAGTTVDRDPKKATRLYETACDEGFASACQLLGIVNIQSKGENKDVEAGFGYINRACQAGRNASCRSLEYACYQGQRPACKYVE
jgi:hypothetical protein